MMADCEQKPRGWCDLTWISVQICQRRSTCSDFSAEFQQSAGGLQLFITTKAPSICIESSLSNPQSLPMSFLPPLPFLHSAESRHSQGSQFSYDCCGIRQMSESATCAGVLMTVGCGTSEQWRGRISAFVLQRPLTSSWISGVTKSKELLHRSS